MCSCFNVAIAVGPKEVKRCAQAINDEALWIVVADQAASGLEPKEVVVLLYGEAVVALQVARPEVALRPPGLQSVGANYFRTGDVRNWRALSTLGRARTSRPRAQCRSEHNARNGLAVRPPGLAFISGHYGS
jgi:hypothetical protein